MTREQFESITAWQEKTFPGGTALAKLCHLANEVDEVQLEIAFPSDTTGTALRHEFADCFILLFGAAQAAGMSYTDISDAIDDKMSINYQRKWGQADENGIVNHIKE